MKKVCRFSRLIASAFIIFHSSFNIHGQVFDSLAIVRKVDSLSDAAMSFYRKSDFEGALICFDSAFLLAERFLNQQDKRYASLLNRKGQCYFLWGNYEEAIPLYLKAKTICEGNGLMETRGYASILSNLANAYKSQGNYPSAERLYLQAKDIFAQVLGFEHPDYASVLNNIGLFFFDKGDFDKAEEMHQEAKRIRAKTLHTKHLDYARSLNNLGSIRLLKGDYGKAEQLFLEAKGILADTFGREHPEYAGSLNNLASILDWRGDFDRAEKLYLEAKEIMATTLGTEHPDYAACLNNLASMYHDKGDYDKAESLHREALEIRAKTNSKEHPDYASSLTNLAAVLRIKGNFENATQLHEDALQILTKTVGIDHPDYASGLNNLAIVCQDKGEYDKAELLCLKTKEIRAKALGLEHPDYAMSLINLASLCHRKGDFDKAEGFYLDAKNIYEKAFGKLHLDYTGALTNLINVYQSNGAYDKANNCFLENNLLTSALLKRAAKFNSEKELLNFLDLPPFTEPATFVFQPHLPQPTDSVLAVAFDNAIARTNALLDACIARENSIQKADSITQAIHQEWKSCHFQLNKWYSRPIAERDSDIVARLEEDAERYEKELARRDSAFVKSRREFCWQDVRAALRPGDRAIEFLSFNYRNPQGTTDSVLYCALVLGPDSKSPQLAYLCEQRTLDSLLAQSESPILDAKISKFYEQPRLYDALWRPLEPHLRGAKRVFYTPAGLLHQLNPGAISINPDSFITLSDHYQLVRVGSTREVVLRFEKEKRNAENPELAEGKKFKTENPKLETAYLFGGIRYEADSTQLRKANADWVSQDSSAEPKGVDFQEIRKTRGSIGGEELEWGYLKNSGEEVAEIEQILKRKSIPTVALRGFEASEERFKAVRSPRILHVATHGFFFPDPEKPKNEHKLPDNEAPVFKTSDNPMMRGGLVLAGANFAWKNKRPLSGMEDGIATASEIARMDLRGTELVVLSACETGLGKMVSNEGVFGLQRAFKIAGAQNLLMSLWKIPDYQTQLMMTAFYRFWLDDGKPVREAFELAQVEVRAKFPNPFFWAGFVLVE